MGLKNVLLVELGDPVDGLYCRQCALLRKKLEEVWSIICDENEIFQDFLNTSESSNDNTNVVNAPQEPFVFNQDPDENSSQSPPHIDHHCCYGCGDSSNGIFCQRCTCESCGNGAHYGYNCPPKVLIISNPEPCYNQNVDEFPQTLPSFHPTCYSGDENSFTYDSNLNFVDDSPNPPPQPPTYSHEFCGNDAHYSHDCPPQVSFIYNPEPCYNQDFNFPQNFQSFQQQYIYCTRCGGPHEIFQCQQVIFYEPCCENCEGPHETFQCQPMNQNFDNSNSSGVDQFQPPQYPVIHHPPQETSVEMLQARENLMESIQTFLKKFNRISFRETPKVLLLAWEKFFEIKNACKEKQHQQEDIQELLRKLLNDVQIIRYTIAITPVLPTVEPDNSLSMGDEHLSTIPEKEESSVEDLVPIPSETEGISDSMRDVPFCDNSTPLEASKDHYEILLNSNDDYSLSDDDSLYNEDIDYVDASPPDSELVSLEVVKDFDPEDGVIDTNILLTIKDDILCEKLLNINILIAKIEALKDNPTPSSDFVTKSPSTSPNSFLEETNIFYNSLPDTETFYFKLEEKSSGNPTSHSDLSLPDYEAFFCDSEPDSGDFTMDVVEDIFDNPTRKPRVHVPDVLPTHPTLHLDSDFTLSSDSLGSDLVVSFPFETRNKIFDLGIFIECLTLCSYFHPSENEDNVFNPGILASNEEKSPHLLSHKGFKAFQLISDFFESSMMIHGEDIPILDDCPDFEASRARGFVLRSLELQHP
ncbi:hypothetical protein Tco_0608585 [Tanacetum coccineum]